MDHGISEAVWETAQRHWIIAMVAERYGVTPYQAALELDRDPERLALRLIPLYSYRDALRTAKGSKDWTKLEESDSMTAVLTNMYYLKHRRVVHPVAEPGCEDCDMREGGQ